ncbi:MAG: class I SAM-dependent methyltransferase [Pseudomonadota bacterium]
MSYSPQRQLLDKLHAAVEWPIILAGIESQIFDLLAQPQTAATVAIHYTWCDRKTALFLDALCSLGLLSKQDDHYELIDGYRTLLNSTHQDTMIPTLQHLTSIRVSSSKYVIDSLSTQERQPTIKTNFSRPQFWGSATDNLRSFHRSVSSTFYVDLLTALPHWSSCKRFLDIGAGSETLANKLLELTPELQCHLFDLDGVIEQIAKVTASQSLNITLHKGDYNKGPLPARFDLVFASMSLYYAHNLEEVISKIYQALTPGGCFVSIHEGLFNDRTQPARHVVGRFIPALNGNDVSFSQCEIVKTMADVGFIKIEHQSINTPFGPMDLDIGYR